MKLLKKLFEIFKLTFQKWQEDDVSQLAAGLAYYTIFSLAPLLIIAITVAGFIWSRSSVETQVLSQLQAVLGKNGADLIKTLLENVTGNLNKGVFASMIGVLALIFGSINIFNQLRNTLNTIWDIRVEKQQGFWKSIKSILLDNILSFGMVMGVGFILLVSIIINTGLSMLNKTLSNIYFLPDFLTALINFVVSLTIITIILAFLFKYLPETEVAWKDVLLGCFITSVLFILGNYAISYYLGYSSIGVTFGAAGSLAVFLVWVYYSAQILFFGAEFTQVYANKFGSRIQASEGARIITSISHQTLEKTYLDKKRFEKYQPDPEISYIARSQSKVFMKDKRRKVVNKKLSDTYKGVLIISVILVVSFVSNMLVRLNFSKRNEERYNKSFFGK